jgi:hypothetical protein
MACDKCGKNRGHLSGCENEVKKGDKVGEGSHCDYCGKPATKENPVTKDEKAQWMHSDCRATYVRGKIAGITRKPPTRPSGRVTKPVCGKSNSQNLEKHKSFNHVCVEDKGHGGSHICGACRRPF